MDQDGITVGMEIIRILLNLHILGFDAVQGDMQEYYQVNSIFIDIQEIKILILVSV